jgi:hypothetical protein
VAKTLEPQDTPAAVTQIPRAPSVPYLCPAHEKWFPEENPWRPLSEWSHNPTTGVPLRTYCKRCDNANKDHYSRRKKARGGPEALKSAEETQKKRQQELDALIADGKGESPEAAGILRHLEYLEGELIPALKGNFHL